jgi:hypothetical protein
MQKAVEEADKRKLLEKEVKQLDRLSFKADKERARQIQSALDKVAEVEVQRLGPFFFSRLWIATVFHFFRERK